MAHISEIFFEAYKNDLFESLNSIDPLSLESVYFLLKTARDNHLNYLNGYHVQPPHIYVCGNGGSAAISNHLVCDHVKGICHDTDHAVPVTSLCSNIPLVTAIANDYDYAHVFSKQVDMLFNPRFHNILIAISSSGSSPNVVTAIQRALEKRADVIAMVGFDGGIVKAEFGSQIRLLHVKSNNYGVVEDCHQSLMHVLAQILRTVNHNQKAPLKL